MQIAYNKRIFGLDILRALAILSVLFAHLLWIFPEARGWTPTLLQLAGIMGVELFFVLSGYLIGGMLYKMFTDMHFHINQLRYFIIRRWFRTLPNYYLILLINILLVLVYGRSLPEDLWKYFFFLQNAWAPMDIFFTESWTLPIEEFAYLIGPILLFFLANKSFLRKARFVFLMMIIAVIGFFIATKFYYSITAENTSLLQWNTDLKAVVLYRIDAIFYGFLAVYISKTAPRFWSKWAIPMALLGSFGLLFFQYMLYSKQLFIEVYPFIWNVAYLPVSSICIALIFPLFSSIKTGPRFLVIPITFVSITSYSLYLLHYSIVLQGMRYLFPVDDLTFIQKLGYSGIYLIVLFCLAYLLYRWYEKPMMDLRDRPFFKKLGAP